MNALLENPWVTGIVTGLVVAGIAWLTKRAARRWRRASGTEMGPEAQPVTEGTSKAKAGVEIEKGVKVVGDVTSAVSVRARKEGSPSAEAHVRICPHAEVGGSVRASVESGDEP